MTTAEGRRPGYHYEPKPGYYYEHVNGTIQWKPFVVVDMAGGPGQYFDSPMVKRWWKVDP